MAHRETVATEEPTIGKLVVDASRDVSSLIQHEIELAKSELKVSVKAGGIGVAMFAAAGFLACSRSSCSRWRSPTSCTSPASTSPGAS